MTLIPRILGAVTAGYGVNELLRPQHLARAARLSDPPVATPPVRVLGAVLGLRDIVSGLAILTLPAGPPLRAALLARASFDSLDCLAFLPNTPGRETKLKIAGITLGWAGLNALATRWAGSE